MEKSSEVNEIAGALSQFQAKVPVIPKNKTAGAGSYSYKYADIADVLTGIRAALSEFGLSVSQSLESYSSIENNISASYVMITTTLLHKSGQWLESSVSGNVDANKGKMSNIQAMGSVTTYLRRYSLASMLGIATDDDVDGNLGDSEKTNAQIEEEQCREHSKSLMTNIKNTEVVAWIKDYLKRNRGLTQMKKIYNITHWESQAEVKIDTVYTLIPQLNDIDEEEAGKCETSLSKINSERVSTIESGSVLSRLDKLIEYINGKINE